MEIRKDYYPNEIAHALCLLSDEQFAQDEWAPSKENYCQAALYDFMAICENPHNREEYRRVWETLQNLTDRFHRGDFQNVINEGRETPYPIPRDKQEKNIFVLYTCDEQRSRINMRVHMCTSDVYVLKDCILDGLRYGTFEYSYDNSTAVNDWIRQFADHFNDCVRREAYGDIAMHLRYGHIEIFKNGEW